MSGLSGVSLSCFERFKGDSQQILLTGGTGFIGTRLVAVLLMLGHRVTVLTRSHLRTEEVTDEALRYIHQLSVLADDFAVDIVINLAGEPLAAKRWSKSQKQLFMSSRLAVTHDVEELIKRLKVKPEVLLNASAIGYYGPHGDEVLSECGEVVGCYSHDLCAAWERAAEAIGALGVRVCILRIGMVLGEEGGSLAELKQPFRRGLSVQVGNGWQWMSWVHRDDLISMMLYLIASDLSGAFNGTAPEPVTNQRFTELMAAHYRIFLKIKAPAWLLNLAVGELANEVLLRGQRVLPERLEASGYVFLYRDLGSALDQLLARKREA